jgi:hypothetical protein
VLQNKKQMRFATHWLILEETYSLEPATMKGKWFGFAAKRGHQSTSDTSYNPKQ